MQREYVLVDALRKAGEEILRHDPDKVDTSSKTREGDLVTTADLASEKVIIETIKYHFPNDSVISEETEGNHDLLKEDNLPNITAWIIDPIDGTNNFKHGMKYSGISIGYIENGQPVLGGVFDPYHDLIYLAQKGQGATCNGVPILVGNCTEFNTNTRVCTSNNMAKGGTLGNLALYPKIGDVWVDVLGSAVLIVCDVASGRLDLYFHTGLKPWDNAAALLIAEESGGKIVGLDGQPVSWLTSEVVVGNPSLVDLFIQKIAGV